MRFIPFREPGETRTVRSLHKFFCPKSRRCGEGETSERACGNAEPPRERSYRVAVSGRGRNRASLRTPMRLHFQNNGPSRCPAGVADKNLCDQRPRFPLTAEVPTDKPLPMADGRLKKTD